MQLGPGTTIILYTDGLIDRRGESLDDAITRLCRATKGQNVDRLCFNVMDRLIGSSIPEDDIALFALRRLPDAS
jgi:serine phosphatase RsbU (regulator of sigma subunit)